MKNPHTPQNMFKKVAFSEKKKILKALTEGQVQILVKGDSDEPFHLLAVQNDGHDALLCHKMEDSVDVNESQKVVINFMYDSDRYYMQTELGFKAGWAVIHTIGDMFQLQRRSSVRIEIPEGIEARFMIRFFKGQSFAIDTNVENISAGGLRIKFIADAPIFKVGDIFEGTLRLGIKRPIDFDVEVRFSNQQALQGHVLNTVGLQFLNIDRIMETRLLSLIMDIQHEIYMKTQKGEIG